MTLNWEDVSTGLSIFLTYFENYFIKATEYFFPVYIASSKHSGGLGESSTEFIQTRDAVEGRVCITVSNFPNPPRTIWQYHRWNTGESEYPLTQSIACATSKENWSSEKIYGYFVSLVLFRCKFVYLVKTSHIDRKEPLRGVIFLCPLRNG